MLNILAGLVSPITGYFTKKTEAKLAIKKKQIERLKGADDAVAEWEQIQAEGANNSWKDEYVTVIVTFPIPVVFVCAFLAVLFENPLIVDAAKAGVDAIKELIPDYGQLVMVVCFAAMGIKYLRR